MIWDIWKISKPREKKSLTEGDKVHTERFLVPTVSTPTTALPCKTDDVPNICETALVVLFNVSIWKKCALHLLAL